MKYIALLALTGAASAVDLAHMTNQAKLFDEMNVQTSRLVENGDKWDGWHAYMHEFPGTINQNGNFMDSYARSIPDPFVGDAAD